MKLRSLIIWLFAAMCLTGCDGKKDSGGAGGASTNLSIVPWFPFLPTPNSYRHIQHVEQLRQKADALMKTNKSIFEYSIFGQFSGKLPKDSPSRKLLGIPPDEPAYVVRLVTGGRFCTIIRSAKTKQWFGEIKVNLKTGRVESTYDVEALFVISEMERRLRQIVGTREEALHLFGGRSRNSPSPEQQRARKALAEALFLPPDAELNIDMSAPGGTNEGQGYLVVSVVPPSGQFEMIATVRYPAVFNIFSVVGLSHLSYEFGGLELDPAWTNLNTQGFLIDSEGIPYPKMP